MDSYTMLLLVVSKEIDSQILSPRWKRGDQQMEATILSSMQMG
jgi:hypothetical protein